MARRPYFPRQELAARGLSPIAVEALERTHTRSVEQAEEITRIEQRVSAFEGAQFDFGRPGPTHADIAALQAQIDALKVLTQPPALAPEPVQDLMYPPPYN